LQDVRDSPYRSNDHCKGHYCYADTATSCPKPQVFEDHTYRPSSQQVDGTDLNGLATPRRVVFAHFVALQNSLGIGRSGKARAASPVTATTDFLAPDSLDNHGREVPPEDRALHSTLLTMPPLRRGARRSPPAERAASSVSRIMARKPKSLAGNNKIGSDCSGNGREPRRVPRIAVQTNIILQDRHREPGRRAFLPFGCLVCRPLLCGDLGAVLACIEHFWVLTSWTLERNDLRRRPRLLERGLTAFGMWP
jgi:hypothetical protein